ncbi:hypothetical protein [Luteitalea sp.]|uniref:hypothetical protein n=1 Tax=Luteitalea sp. TaxID=2004800 RepID=UPI0025C2B20E|nr:hypothetical protein [Luteitalea sp.]
MDELITHRARPACGQSLSTRALVHDFGRADLPEFHWVTQPRPGGAPEDPGGEQARLTGRLRLGPMAFYVELVEVGYTKGGCQDFVPEQDAAPDACERTLGPDIHRAIGGAIETFLWNGREYALIVAPYGA